MREKEPGQDIAPQPTGVSNEMKKSGLKFISEIHLKPDPGVTDEYPVSMASRAASRFEVDPPVEVFEFAQKGNINRHTFLVKGNPDTCSRDFLLQRINQQVFFKPENVMKSMLLTLEAQRRGVEEGRLPKGRNWEVVELVPTRGGEPYLKMKNTRGIAYWRLMIKIPGCLTYKSLNEVSGMSGRKFIAEEAGRGLAIYNDLTSGMDIEGIKNPLPGYRETGIYYNQLKSVLQGNRTFKQAAGLLPSDPDQLESCRRHFLVHLEEKESTRRINDPELQSFIEMVRNEEEFAMTLIRGLKDRTLRRLAIHGDTKLDNFLFSQEDNRVISLIDLDTIMPQTWLVDWGDMVRSLCNIAGEKEPDPEKIQVDLEIYESLARGFLSTARTVTPEEIRLMPEAVEIISLELGMRFLTDYLRGDSYFKLGPNDFSNLNKIRAISQLTLFQKLKAARSTIKKIMDKLNREFNQSNV